MNSLMYIISMPGEGFIMHMITSLRNNKRERNSLFDEKTGKTSGTATFKNPVFYKKASPEELEAVRDKMRRQQKWVIRIQLAFLAILIAVSIWLFVILSV